jgi:hypothetical protein
LVIVLCPALANNKRVLDSKSEIELDMVSVELPVPPYLLLLLALLLVFFALPRRKDARHLQRLRLPPGPWALLVIGHLHHLAGGVPPHHTPWDLARRHGPLMMLRFCELPVVVVLSPAAARDTTEFRAFAESGVPLGEGPFPLGEGFTERKLLATASRRHSTGEELFAESTWGPSR